MNTALSCHKNEANHTTKAGTEKYTEEFGFITEGKGTYV